MFTAVIFLFSEKTPRIKFTKEQLEVLQKKFAANSKPSRDEKETIAQDFGVQYEKIDNWFKNARSKA